MIRREDMLELTRRMTPERHHLTRICGCYVDARGEYDGSFNTLFRKLTGADFRRHLEIARQIPFSQTNEELKDYPFPGKNDFSRQAAQLLLGLKSVGLKNDALAETWYDVAMEHFPISGAYSLLLFHGAYDVPRKTSLGEYQLESEEVYEYLIGAVCPQIEDSVSGQPWAGFLYPMFSERSADVGHIAMYRRADSPVGFEWML